MTVEAAIQDDPPAEVDLATPPIREIHRDGVHYVLLGTAHVSRTSADAVRKILEEREFDVVAVELCPAAARPTA